MFSWQRAQAMHLFSSAASEKHKSKLCQRSFLILAKIKQQQNTVAVFLLLFWTLHYSLKKDKTQIYRTLPCSLRIRGKATRQTSLDAKFPLPSAKPNSRTLDIR